MPKIAISYRRQDSADVSARIYDRLVDRYGRENVFIDIDKIPSRVDFRNHIASEFARIDVLVVIVGLSWLSRDAAGVPRLTEINDPVRIEIEHARNRGLSIVPVLVDGSEMPNASDFPASIVDFRYINAINIGGSHSLDDDEQKLLNAIDTTIADRKLGGAEGTAFDAPRASTQGGKRTRRSAQDSLASWIEKTVISRGPVELSVLAVFAAFMMAMASQVFGLAWLERSMPGGGTKQVGFLSAPNWTVVYLVLFPPYLALFAVLMSRWQNSLKIFCEQRLILASDGSPVPVGSVVASWKMALKRASRILWLLMFAVIAQTISEWVRLCYIPLTTGKIRNYSVDWGRLAILEPDKADVGSSLIFSAIAYSYMGFALFVYLAVLAFMVTLALFLKELSDETGLFRLVLSNPLLGRHFAVLFDTIFVCSVLGIGAAICMRMQAEYIRSDYSEINQLLFSDLIRVFGGGSASTRDHSFWIPSEFTSFAELVVTLLILFLVLYQMHEAFEKARNQYLSDPERFTWPKRSPPQAIAERVRIAREYTFVKAVAPQFFSMAIVLTGAVLSYFMIGYATVWLSTIILALVRFTVAPALQPRPLAPTAADGRAGD